MEIGTIIETVMNQGVFGSLFIWLFFTYQKESKDREERLMKIVDNQSDKLGEISLTLERIREDIKAK
mgnify:CR=1 FL=1